MVALPLAGFRILIVEDEYLIAMDVEQICRDYGAEEAVLIQNLDMLDTAIFDQCFDVAVMDVVVHGGSTLNFAKRLRERNVPFVFATGYDKTAEAFGYFSDVPTVGKPYSGEQLINAIIQAVSRNRAPFSPEG